MVEYRLGNAQNLDLHDASFNVYCSFETIEHVPEPELLVSEARRVLRKGGLFLVSTPNRVFSGLAKGEKPSNPFHFQEWSLLEFDAILKKEFSQVQYFCQRIRSENKLHPLSLEAAKPWLPMVYLAVCKK